MVARLRRLREQRERNSPPSPPPRRPGSQEAPAESRFMFGDTVFCMPWGNGQVRSCRVEGDRELLVVHFAEHGDLTIDTEVSAVRLVSQETPDEDDT
jgi:hypothetical protein